MADIFGTIQQDITAARGGVSSAVSSARRSLDEQQESEEARLAAEAGAAKGDITLAEEQLIQEAASEVREAEIRAQLPGMSRAELGQAKAQATVLEAAVREAAVEAKLGVTEAELEALTTLEEIFAEADEELSASEIEALIEVGEAEKEAIAELMKFRGSNIRLAKTGEWVDRAEFEALDVFTQKMLNAHGLEGYQDVVQEAQSSLASYTTGEQINLVDALADNPQIEMSLFNLGISAEDVQSAQQFISSNMRLKSTGDWIPREDFNALDSLVQSLLHKHGIEGYKNLLEEAEQKLQPYMSDGSVDLAKALEEDSSLVSELKLLGISDSAIQDAREFSKDNIYTSDGKWISEEWISTLPENEQQVIESEGIDSWQEEFYMTLPSGELIDKTSFEEMPETFQEAVMLGGLEAISMEGLTPEEQFTKHQSLGNIPDTAEFTGADDEGNIMYSDSNAPILGVDLTSVPTGQPQVAMLIKEGLIPEGSIYFGKFHSLGGIPSFTNFPGIDMELSWTEPDGTFRTAKDLLEATGYEETTMSQLTGGLFQSPLDLVPLAWIRNVDEMDSSDIAVHVALDAVFIGTIFFGGAMLRGSTSLIRRTLPSVRRVATLASDAGKAERAMLTAVNNLNKLNMGKLEGIPKGPSFPRATLGPSEVGGAGSRYTELAAKAHSAIDASRLADNKFIQSFGHLKSVTSGELKRFEKLSGVDGLSNTAKEVQVASRNLEKAWGGLDREVWGTTGYQSKLSNVFEAKQALSTSLESYGKVMSPRVATQPHVGWIEVINLGEKNVVMANDTLNTLRKLPDSFFGGKKDLILREALEDLDFMEAELATMRAMAASREAAPTWYTSAALRGFKAGGQIPKRDPWTHPEHPTQDYRRYLQRIEEPRVKPRPVRERVVPEVAREGEVSVPEVFKRAFPDKVVPKEVTRKLTPTQVEEVYKKMTTPSPGQQVMITPATAKPLVGGSGSVYGGRLIPAPQVAVPGMVISNPKLIALTQLGPTAYRVVEGTQIQIQSADGTVSYVSAEKLSKMSPQQVRELLGETVSLKLRNGQLKPLTPEQAIEIARQADLVANIATETAFQAAAKALAEGQNSAQAQAVAQAVLEEAANATNNAFAAGIASTYAQAFSRAAAQTASEGYTQSQTKTLGEGETKGETKMEPLAKIDPYTQPYPVTMTETQTKTLTKTQTQTQPLTVTETAVQTKTATQLKTPKPMTTKHPFFLPILPDFADEYKKRKKAPVTVDALEGAVTFRFGMRWVTVVPPYQNQDIFYTDMPIMESLQQEDVGKPDETLQIIRTAREPAVVPREIWITDDSIGMFDVHIYNTGQSIRFVKKPPQPSALEIAESLEDLSISEAREYLDMLSPNKRKKVMRLLNVGEKSTPITQREPSPKWKGRDFQPSVTELRNGNE